MKTPQEIMCELDWQIERLQEDIKNTDDLNSRIQLPALHAELRQCIVLKAELFERGYDKR